jgi:acetyl-CoA carboxylase biotin carboxyl carrier protein
MDEQIIFALIDRFDSGSMTSLDFSSGDLTLSLRKSSAPEAAAPPLGRDGAARASGRESSAPGAGVLEAGVPAAPNGASGISAIERITSPIVGVFYASSEPDSPPFVKAGSIVKAGQALCVIEAMKMMNKLEAEFDCEIVAVKASGGEMVEYGEVLFEVKRL